MKKKTKSETLRGMNLLAALKLAASLGFEIHPIRRSGEVLVFHTYFPKPFRISVHRRDCPRALSCRIGQVLRYEDN